MPAKRRGKSGASGGTPATPRTDNGTQRDRSPSSSRSPGNRNSKSFQDEEGKSGLGGDQSVVDAPAELQNPANLRVGAGGLYWLTFMNGSLLSETQIRDLFSVHAKIVELDGAIDGPSDGWVMVALETERGASKVLTELKNKNAILGRTIQMINAMMEESMDVNESETSKPDSSSCPKSEEKNKENITPEMPPTNEIWCARCDRNNHTEESCRSREKLCKVCDIVGHFDAVHQVTDPKHRRQIIALLDAKLFADWPESKQATPKKSNEKIPNLPKPVPAEKPADIEIKTESNHESGEQFGEVSKSDRLSSSSVEGLKHFTSCNNKILQMVSHNNHLLTEKLTEVTEDGKSQLKEKDEQIKKLQNLLNNKDDQMEKLTNKINSSTEFEAKVKKFFGENEDFHKKRVTELTESNKELMARLEESEKRRLASVLEDSDTSKLKEALENMTCIQDNIQQKTDQVWEAVSSLEAGGIIRSGSNSSGDLPKGEAGTSGMVSSTVGLLHNKVDKMIRLMVETSEAQKKMNKVLGDLVKNGGFTKPTNLNGEEEDSKKKKKKDKERDKSRERERKTSKSPERDSVNRSRSSERSTSQQAAPPPQIDHEFEEMKWGHNLALVGDGHWKSFNIVADIQEVVKKMEKKVNLKVMGKEGETLSRMYDEQSDTMFFPLPAKVHKVGISIGTYDLKDNSLITLREASMEEVRRRNEAKLIQKANCLRELIHRLIGQNKSVVLMIPPHGEERIELHHHWEEIVLDALKGIRFPKLRILNMAQVMRTSMSEFRNNDEYLDMWLSPTPKPRRYLSAYGTRRMFYALRQTITAKTPQAAGMGDWLSMYPHHNQKSGGGPGPAAVATAAAVAISGAIAGEEENAFPCPRCTRHHPGGQDKCKSIDKLCRKCNNIGHFTEVHDITDPKFRQLITNTLGINLWPDWDPQPSKDSEALTPSRGKRPIVDEYGYEPESKRGRADPVHPVIGEVGPGDSPPPPPPPGNPPSAGGNNRRVSLEKLTEMERRLGLDRVSPPDTRTDLRGPPGPAFQGGFQRQGGYDDYDRGGYGGNRGYGGGQQNHRGGGRGGWSGRGRDHDDWYNRN